MSQASLSIIRFLSNGVAVMSSGAFKRTVVLHAGSLTKMKLSPKEKEGRCRKRTVSNAVTA
ncbi:hypothetical protein AERO8C_200052 [Aeromonas veronii]|uniref:Uncharacterized protein n=1 Tax=Aeromonas veronii TaxID=654 RepID=A0A653L550_AERVE|nr:hypothetical protein AERO8C_200052 [Aeromonas veronii]